MGSIPCFERCKYRSILPRHEEIPIPRKAFRLAHPLVAGGLFIGLTWTQHGGLHAQNLDDPGSDDGVSASIGTFVRGAEILGGTEAMMGGEASLHFSRHFSIGAVGGGLLNSVPVVESGADLGTNLRMGYGGLLFGYQARTRRSVSLAGRLLVGAGHASIRAVPVGNELGADNFLVMEPEVLVRVRALGPVHLGAAAGYRAVFGVQDLLNLADADLQGMSLTLVLLIL